MDDDVNERARKDRDRLLALEAAERLADKVAAQQRTHAGQIIAFSQGSYSDYQVKCHMRALAEFGTVDEMIAFKASDRYKVVQRYNPEGEPSSYGCTDRFIAWLQAKGLIEPVEPGEVMEWWIGDDRDMGIE